MLEFQRVSIFQKRSDFEISCSQNQNQEEIKMPVDFTAYLLSSSPPGFSLYNNLSTNMLSQQMMKNLKISSPMPVSSSFLCDTDNEIHKDEVSDISSDSTLKSNSPVCVCYSCQLKLSSVLMNSSLFLASDGSEDEGDNDDDDDDVDGLECRCRSLSLEDSADSTNNSDNDCSHTAAQPLVKTKRVSFADCRGYTLTEVRVMSESSDSPPDLKPEVLSKLQDEPTTKVSDISPLQLDFSQPASDYYMFREKLQEQSVCLENVILKQYNVLGTVKVKNISFQKQVCVRVSFDSWKTYKDFEAKYVSSGDEKNGPAQYDTFTFEFTIPTDHNPQQPVEFCVQYKCDAGEFWDNNHTHNFRIVSSDYVSPRSPHYTKDFKPNFSEVEVWSEYSTWHHLNGTDSAYY